MPFVEVWASPYLLNKRIPAARRSIQERLAAIPELGLRPEQLTVRFPAERDMPAHDVTIHIWGLFLNEDRTPEVKNKMARVAGECIRQYVGIHPLIEVLVDAFDPSQGFWVSPGALSAS